MGKKLAIKGHPTRGNEVIELLMMMGGKSTMPIGAILDKSVYTISEGEIFEIPHYNIEFYDFVIFTLEEFLEKYPFKLGDKVIDIADGCPGTVSEMKWDEDVSDMKYFVAFGNGIDFGWYVNDAIEFCNENKNLEETQSKRDIDKSEFIIKHMILPNKVDDKLEYEIIDGYEFDKVENNKIILKPIKPKYPTTYEECKEMLPENVYYGFSIFMTLQKLIICRDVYWKIAGEEMGLDKPWEPDWSSFSEGSYPTITKCNGMIVKTSIYTHDCLLAFPTEEMRNVFYENFKDLIEQCKELL